MAASTSPLTDEPLGDPAPPPQALRGRRGGIGGFVLRRLGAGVATLLVASILIFAAVQVLPGDVASLVLGRNGTAQRLAAVRADLHLNRSFPERYWDFLTGFLTGHLGNSSASMAQGRVVAVSDIIQEPLRNSLVLAGITLLVFCPLCLLLGTLAALRAGRFADHAISVTALAIGAMPEFLVGTLLVVVFFTQLNLLPPVALISPGETPFSHPKALVLPVLTLLGVSVAFGSRLLRAATIEVLREDYVRMARVNGIPERRVVSRFALRNALAPSVQVLAQMIQYLIGGIIITENVFDYPGIGNKLVQAVSIRDAQVIIVIATILAAIYIFVNILADLAVVLLVPRLRTQV